MFCDLVVPHFCLFVCILWYYSYIWDINGSGNQIIFNRYTSVQTLKENCVILNLRMKELNQHLLNVHNFTEAEVQTVVSYFKRTELKKGAYFLKQGAYCKKVAFVAKGALFYYANIEGEEKVCDFAFEDDWISQFKSLINKVPSELSIKTLEDTILLEISGEQLVKLTEIVPKIIQFQANLTQQFFIKSIDRASNLANLTAKERYVKEISQNNKLVQRIPQYHLASYLGIKPQSLSRIRNELI